MSDDGLITAKCRLLEIFANYDNTELENIEKWISSQAYKKDLEKKKSLLKGEKKLKRIGDYINKLIPFEAEMATESISPPVVGDQADCNKENTCHVDEFLYDENQVEDLVKKGKVNRNYCLDCNSRNVKELTYISHSMSRRALQYIFHVLLPKDLENKQLVDIGSRLGAVLYGAYNFSNASKIVGIEINKEFCDVQEATINKFSMQKERIEVIHADVITREDIVQSADIIVINVLDFFVDVDKHKEMWFFFKKHIKKGCYLVANRSMAETLGYLEIYEQFMDWLTICKPFQLDNEIFFEVEDYSELYLYTIN
ncbi:uncharacterized protein LOC116770584 [Danaus plexippus]|uniref:Uncharacterized protein n=1 Tax=Danaus plexippus plexippus TaxID=278856 RepID=A0A212F8M8_DANPL|nr:uncharacterized protein LOC116770584 [Danaus plexippus]OWR50106.1 hypothetical protein KGM_207865 [Danaus plexippus plexippus]